MARYRNGQYICSLPGLNIYLLTGWLALILVGHCTMDGGPKKRLFSNFQANVCPPNSPDDIKFYPTTYVGCINKCLRRVSCISISYHLLQQFCRLHTVRNDTQACKGYVYSEKENWEDKNNCKDGIICAPGEICTKSGCDKKECPWPDAPSNGKILGNDRRQSKYIVYICNAGYVLQGHASRQCKSNGEWDNPVPQCIPQS